MGGAAARPLETWRSQPLYTAVLRQLPLPKSPTPATAACAAAVHAPSNLSRSRSESGGSSPPSSLPAAAAVLSAQPSAGHSYASVAGSRARSPADAVEHPAAAGQLPDSQEERLLHSPAPPSGQRMAAARVCTARDRPYHLATSRSFMTGT